MVRSAAEARALPGEEPELSNTGLRKKQKLVHANVAEKNEGIKMTHDASWVRKVCESNSLVALSPELRASPAAVVE